MASLTTDPLKHDNQKHILVMRSTDNNCLAGWSINTFSPTRVWICMHMFMFYLYIEVQKGVNFFLLHDLVSAHQRNANHMAGY